MNRKLLLGGVASVALMAGTAQAATLTNSFVIYPGTGVLTPIAPGPGGIVELQPDTLYRVGWRVTVGAPNVMEVKTETNPDTGEEIPFGAGEPLGLAVVSGQIRTAGVPGLFVPVGTVVTPGQPARWNVTFPQVVNDANAAPPFINLGDLDADTDLDVDGAGIANLQQSLSDDARLPQFQMGAKGVMDILRGQFRTGTGNGSVTLRTVTSSANVFMDPAGAGNALAAQPLAPGGVTEGQLVVQVGTVVPPGGTMGLGATGNGGTAITLNITGGNGGYVSSVFTAPAGTNVVRGTANLSAIGQEGPVLVLVRFSDTDTANGPALPGFIDTIAASDGSTLARVTGAQFTALAGAYPFLNDPNAAVFRITDPDRIFNFDFTGQGGIGVAQLAAVPEPTVIGVLGMAGLGLLARRRRNA